MKPALTLLIAEDEESDFELLELALLKRAPGICIRWVRDGAEAKRYIAGEGPYADRTQSPLPHVLITDLKMPRVTGTELLEWVKSEERWRWLPVIVMSSSNQPSDIDRAYTRGASAYFLKPANFEGLIELCERLVSYWQLAMHHCPH